ncbi:hypothetical protein FN846DRAFT_171255 [Sphaerosporella brunnea]|uniref:Uncharacterized protein n=1 Tax=Sphaerosporella brunnea TaxID=1250544 RepID=A0A5J5EQM5_9PEZI|nr:hypothetical protein FN846DRAFT_171255 [Sphaerosporella brunnea]
MPQKVGFRAVESQFGCFSNVFSDFPGRLVIKINVASYTVTRSPQPYNPNPRRRARFPQISGWPCEWRLCSESKLAVGTATPHFASSRTGDPQLALRYGAQCTHTTQEPKFLLVAMMLRLEQRARAHPALRSALTFCMTIASGRLFEPSGSILTEPMSNPAKRAAHVDRGGGGGGGKARLAAGSVLEPASLKSHGLEAGLRKEASRAGGPALKERVLSSEACP